MPLLLLCVQDDENCVFVYRARKIILAAVQFLSHQNGIVETLQEYDDANHG
jgi:hypothetical protein